MVKIKRFPICDFRFAILRPGLPARVVMTTLVLAFSFVIYNSQCTTALAQQPQAPAGTPLYSVNAKYVNGVAPGYWATAGSGLTLNLSAGTAYCGNPPAPLSYSGGTLTMTASATNYVYLDPANNCAPAASTSAFNAGEIPIATVVTGASSITSVTDARTWFTPQPCVTSPGGALNCSSLGANQNIALTPSGAGATVVTNLVDKGGQVFNVKAYGAKGDGKTDDSAAFQSAYNAAVAVGGGTVLIPPTSACYLLNTAINMTGTSIYRGVIIKGVSLKYTGVGVGATGTICGNTGGIVFDVTGSGGITFKDVDVTSQSGVTNPSLVGLYAARDSAGAGAQGINVIGCHFKMVTHTSGTTYSFGSYLYGSEEDYFSHDTFTADYPLVMTEANDFNVHSAFLSEYTGSKASNTDDSFTDMELQSSGLGPAAYFDGAHNATLTGHSWDFSVGPGYSSSLYQYALEFTGTNFSIFVNWRQEGYPGFAFVRNNLLGSVFMGNDAPGSSPELHAVEFEDASAQIINDTFRILDEYATPTTNYFYDATASSPAGVAVLDDVNFYCGNQANCGDIPIGNYQPGGWSLYQADVRFSGGPTNEHPVFETTGSGILTRFPNSAATISFGSGAPTGTCVTPSLYLRTDGGTGSTFYVCEGSAWVAK